MLGRTVGTIAIGALSASALIIPPGVDVESKVPGLSVFPVDPKSQAISLPCPECAFSAKEEKVKDVEDEDDGLFWIQGGANNVLMNFSVSENGQHLQLNGETFYPVVFHQDGPFDEHTYTVKQVPSQAELAEIASGDITSSSLEVTAYSVRVFGEQALTPNGDVVVSVLFEIASLNDEMVGVDAVEVRLLKTGDGELLIMDLIPHPNSNPTFQGRPLQPEGFAPEDLDLDLDFLPPPPPPPARPGFEGIPEDMDYPPPPSPGYEGMPDFPSPPPPEFEGIPEDLDFPSPPPPPPHHGRPQDRPHGHQHGHKHKECSVLPRPLCKLKNILESKIDHAMGPGRSGKHGRPCPGREGRPNKLPGHIKPHLSKPGEEHQAKHHHGRPHHMRPHGGHHGHHGHFFGRHFLRAFAKGLVAVLIPVMAGVAVGMTVSLVGLLVGRLVSLTWIKLARGGRRGYASVAQEETALEVGEHKAMLAEMEAPPVYEEAPAYEEAGEEKR